MDTQENKTSGLFDDLAEYEASVYSQGGEDGALSRIFDVIGHHNRYFVEFGAWDGLHLSNTANLRLNGGWQGLLLEGSNNADGELVKREFVSADNINQLFAKYDVPKTFDLLSIDIDGNEYWVWKALEDFSPRVVVVEYNVFFPVGQACTIPYDPNWIWDRSYYHGASIAALRKLGRSKGYRLVYTDRFVPNAFFIRESELPADYYERPLSELTLWNLFDHAAPVDGRPWVNV
jgi:hypothetical protein